MIARSSDSVRVVLGCREGTVLVRFLLLFLSFSWEQPSTLETVAGLSSLCRLGNPVAL